MEKKGAGHIEFILAIVLFIGIVSFAVFFFNPASGDRTVSSALTYSILEIEQNASVRLDSFSIVVNTVGEVIDVDVGDSFGTPLAMNYDENVNFASSYQPGVVTVNPGNDDFVLLRVSEGITERKVGTSPGVAGGTENSHQIASSTSREIVSEARLKELEALYQSNYEQLKIDFNLPGINFGFIIDIEGENIDATRTPPEGLEVFSDVKRIEVLTEDGDIVFADLVVRVW